MIELCGEKVCLHTLEREHCRVLWEAYEPTEPLPTAPLTAGLSVEGADKWFDEIQANQGREQVYLGIFTCDGTLIGDIQLAQIDWRHRTASLGLGIARAADRQHGYGTGATLTLVRYGFDHLNLYRIAARTLAFNTGMQRVLEKCGFVLEGRERQAVYIGGQRWDRLIYGLLRER